MPERRVKAGDPDETVGGYRRGEGRAWLAWFDGGANGDVAGNFQDRWGEAFGSEAAARRWLRQLAKAHGVRKLNWLIEDGLAHLRGDTRIYYTAAELAEIKRWES